MVYESEDLARLIMKKTEFWPPIDLNGHTVKFPDPLLVKVLILYVGKEYWCSGAGSGYFDYKNDLSSGIEIMFMEELDGFYLRYSGRDGGFHSYNKEVEEKIVIGYVGGNPLNLSSRFFISRENTLKAIEYFLETGKRTDLDIWINGDIINWDYGVV